MSWASENRAAAELVRARLLAGLDREEASIARRALDGDAERLAHALPRAELAPAPRGAARTGGSR